VPAGALRVGDVPVAYALGRELPPVHSWSDVVRLRLDRARSAPASLAVLGQAPYRGHGLSYILMLVAFYVDNGKQLPLWKDLPHFMYWLIPIGVGTPLIVRALLWPPLARARAEIST